MSEIRVEASFISKVEEKTVSEVVDDILNALGDKYDIYGVYYDVCVGAYKNEKDEPPILTVRTVE